MKIDLKDDILQPLSDEKLAEYQAACQKRLPRALRPHHLLIMQKRWKEFVNSPENKHIAEKISPLCKYNLYVHRSGNVDNCTFVGISWIEEKFNGFILYLSTLQESGEELYECLRDSNRIPWEKSPILYSLNTKEFEVVQKVANEKQWKIFWSNSGYSKWLSKEEALNFTYEIPDDIYVAPLKAEHAELVNETWPHRYPGSDEYLRSTIIMNGGLGLFDKNTNQALCWVIKNDNLIPGFLYTADCAKRRGFASLLTKIFCKKYAEEENLDMFVGIMGGNVPSLSLFSKLGFKDNGTLTWLQLTSLPDGKSVYS